MPSTGKRGSLSAPFLRSALRPPRLCNTPHCTPPTPGREEWLCFSEWGFKSRDRKCPLSRAYFAGLCLCVFTGALGNPDLDIRRADAFVSPYSFQGQKLGAGSGSGCRWTERARGPAASAPALGTPVRAFGPARRSRGTCASAKFAFAALGSFGIRAEASLLCKQTQRSSSPDPPFCTYTVSCFCCCP